VYEGRTDFERGRILGHENLGERVAVGDMVVLPFDISCGFNCLGTDAQGSEHPNITLNDLVNSVKFAGTIGVVGVYVARDPKHPDPLYASFRWSRRPPASSTSTSASRAGRSSSCIRIPVPDRYRWHGPE